MAKKIYEDTTLNSLHEVLQKNPTDFNLKKHFALELQKKGELRDAYPLLLEVFELDKDVNIERSILQIESQIDSNSELRRIKGEGKGMLDVLTKLEKLEKGKITFSDVAGMDDVKEAIRLGIIYPYQHPELYKAYNKQAGGGILMYGPPGCGKTYISKATAGELGVKFFAVSIHEVLNKFIGKSEQYMHEIFETARRAAPAVLFFDEIDAIGISRTSAAANRRSLVNQFLTEMDGISSSNQDLLIIGATNLPWQVDTALRRSGRFDKVIFVAPPDKIAAKRIFQLNLQDKPHDEMDLDRLVELALNFSSADIAKVCGDAGDSAFKEAIKVGKVVNITQLQLEESISKTFSTVTDWFTTAQSYVSYSNQSGQYDEVRKFLGNSKR